MITKENKILDEQLVKLDIMKDEISKTQNVFQNKLKLINFDSEKLELEKEVHLFDQNQIRNLNFLIDSNHNFDCGETMNIFDNFFEKSNKKLNTNCFMMNQRSPVNSNVQESIICKSKLSPVLNVTDSLDLTKSESNI